MPKSGRTYQVKLYLSKAGHQRLDQVLHECGRLYNDALEVRKNAYRNLGITVANGRAGIVKERPAERGWPSPEQISNQLDNHAPNGKLINLGRMLTEWNATNPELKSIPRRVKVGVLERLDRAFDAFFRRLKAGEKPGYPRYRSASRYRTLEVHAGYENWLRCDEEKRKGWVAIPGLPRMEFRLNRELPEGKPNIIRITRKARRVVASLVYTVLDPEPSADAPKNPVGIDAGVTNRLTLSDGTILPGRRQDRRRIKRLQHKLSRTGVSLDGKGRRRVDVEWQKLGRKWMRPSGGRRKVAKSLAKEQQQQAESDRNAKHRLTTDLVRQYDYFAVEDLQIRNMTRSAKGTADNPGTNVRQKAGLNRGILEQGWGEIFTQIAYKAASAGKRFEKINPQYTSQTCSVCGVTDGKSRRSQAVFVCTGCGHADNADVNAAKNILSLGLKDLGGGGTLTSNGQSPGVRQGSAHRADDNRGSGAPFGGRQETRRHATKTDAQSDKNPLHWQQLVLPGFS